MAKVYFITGTLGGGKSLCAVDMIRKYLSDGKKVATNMNLNLEYLCSPNNKHSRVIRVPDAPEISDLRAIGYGSDKQDANTHGLLILDELGTWFNARDFSNKGRMAVIKWMIHMRKRRWDVGFLVQDFSMVDKQARGNIAQYLVSCKSSKDFWLFRPLPKFHIANVLHGPTKTNSGNWYYKGKDVYNAYDTEQLYHTGDEDDIVDSDAEMSTAEKRYRELNGLYSVLPTGYLGTEGNLVAEKHFSKINKGKVYISIGLAVVIALAATYSLWPASQPVQANTETIEQQELSHTVDLDENRTTRAVSTNDITERFDAFRIIRYTNFGGKKSYTVSDGSTQYDTDQLAQMGYTVTPRSRDELLLVDENYEFTSIN